MPGVVPRLSCYLGGRLAKELSIFADESGDRGVVARHYLLSLVFHNQSDNISSQIEAYEGILRDSGLPDVPFHSEPLLNGHKAYDGLTIEQRKKMLSAFGSFVRHLPISYCTFSYERREVVEPIQLSANMRRDISNFMFDNLAFFQSFDDVKVYYDDGQDVVSRALRDSVGFVLSKSVVVIVWSKWQTICAPSNSPQSNTQWVKTAGPMKGSLAVLAPSSETG